MGCTIGIMSSKIDTDYCIDDYASEYCPVIDDDHGPNECPTGTDSFDEQTSVRIRIRKIPHDME